MPPMSQPVLEIAVGPVIANGRSGMHDLRRDTLYALRTFRKRPVFTVIVILTLTLSIAVNAGVFTMLSRGVLSRDFRYPQPETQGDPDLFGLMSPAAAPPRSSRNIRAIGRLQPGVTVAQARADLAAIAAELERRYPAENARAGVVVERLLD